LRRELELTNLYLDIQRVRFQDRLTIEVNFSPATLDALVPTLLLQPLVENAVRHGVSKTSAPVRIELKSSLSGSLLEIQVCDDGPGVSEGTSGNGVGLSNTRARLQQLYGNRQSLRLDCVAGGRTVATVQLPYHAEGGYVG
jgi:LytS/YehU family sensor histidine kinase